jgi:hypothetical protein
MKERKDKQIESMLQKYVGKPNNEETRAAIVEELKGIMTKKIFKVMNAKVAFGSKKKSRVAIPPSLSINFTVSFEDEGVKP